MAHEPRSFVRKAFRNVPPNLRDQLLDMAGCLANYLVSFARSHDHLRSVPLRWKKCG